MAEKPGPEAERERVVAIALERPELTPRELAQNARQDLIAQYEALKQPEQAAKYRLALDGAQPAARAAARQ